ncbi:MAG: deoxyribonuclease IV [Candidatus Onthovivens sp.]|nr:deoxyribonuclease IV [Candidatus Onthovivens sp.]
MLIGSHVGMNGPSYFVGSVKDALKCNETCFMFYTGAPQNSIRTPIEKCKIEEGLKLMEENNIDIKNCIVHAPYLINLGNIDEYKNQLGRDLLISELRRTSAFHVDKIVLHPGLHVHNGEEVALKKIVESLDYVFSVDNTNVMILIETMAGKGTEVGKTFEEVAYILNNSKYPSRLGVCLDTCHINDAGYDVSNVDKVIGLNKLKAIHLNDSKNARGSHKDRHENIGFGTIGFDTLNAWVKHEALRNVPKILETPYINDKMPYKEEIEMLKEGKFNPSLKDLF